MTTDLTTTWRQTVQATRDGFTDTRSELKRQSDEIKAAIEAAAGRGESSLPIGRPDDRIRNALTTAGYTLTAVVRDQPLQLEEGEAPPLDEFICSW